MNYYAIGTRYRDIRMVITAINPEIALRNCRVGEVAVPVDGPVTGKISGDGKSVIPAGPDMRAEGDKIKAYRFNLLQACDWTALPDAPLTPEKKLEWAAYRQALRDITDDQPNVMFEDVVWPDEPSK